MPKPILNLSAVLSSTPFRHIKQRPLELTRLGTVLATLGIVAGGSWGVGMMVSSLLTVPIPAPPNGERQTPRSATEIADRLASQTGAGNAPPSNLRQSPPSIHLTGLLGAGTSRQARAILIVDGADKPVVAGIGDPVNPDWQIAAITRDGVRLKSRDGVTEVDLQLPRTALQGKQNTPEKRERD